MNNADSIKKVLDELGFTYETGTGLRTTRTYGAGGESVDIRLTGYKSGKGSGDLRAIGLRKTADGTYEAVGDFYHLRDAEGKSLRNAQGLSNLGS
jgi:hypothetical protein